MHDIYYNLNIKKRILNIIFKYRKKKNYFLIRNIEEESFKGRKFLMKDDIDSLRKSAPS